MTDERMKRNEKAGQTIAVHHGFNIIVSDTETVYGHARFEVIDPATGKGAGCWYQTAAHAKACATKLAKANKSVFDYRK